MVSSDASTTNGKGRAALLFSVLAVACVVAAAFIVVDSDGSEAEETVTPGTDTQLGSTGVYWRADQVNISETSFFYRIVVHGSGSLTSVSEIGMSRYGTVAVVIEDGVTLDGRGCFERQKISSVSLGKDVTSIPVDAFRGCYSLKTVSMSAVTEIGKYAFYGCSVLETIDLSGVISIGEYAFGGCGALDTTLPDSLETIGAHAFEGCTSLSGLKVPEKVTEICCNTFEGCTGLVSADLNNVQTLGTSAFRDCGKLKTVSMPAIKTIGDGVFSACTSLETVEFGKDLNSVAEYAFQGCAAMKSYSVAGGGSSPYCTEDGVLFLNNGRQGFSIDGQTRYCEGKYLIAYPAAKAGTSYAIPEDTVYIYGSAFYGCENLVSITLPEGLFGTGWQAFSGCTALKNIEIPASVMVISSIKGDINTAFNGCSSLERIDVDPSNTRYSSVDGVLFDKEQKMIMVYPSAKAGSSYVLPSTVESICQFAFEDCVKLNSVTIGDNVKTINTFAFHDCGALTSLTFGSGMSGVTIGTEAFVIYANEYNVFEFYDADDNPIPYGDGLAGKTFVGNNRGNGIMKEYVGPTYSITWKDADGKVIDTTAVAEGVVPTHGDPVRESSERYDYTFAGWSPALKAATEDATYTATFTESTRKYTVTFEYNGMNISRTKEYGGTLSELDLPNITKEYTKEGKTYVFAKWVYADDESKVFDISAPITENMTLVPVYEVKKFTVRWIVEGEVVKTEKLESGSIPQWSGDAPVKEADAQYTYKMNGWEGLVSGVTIIRDTDFTAKFTPVLRSYDISFVNGDSTVKTVLDYGAEIIKPESDPAKGPDDDYGYVFIGWNGFTDGMTVTGEATFEAMYKAVLGNLPEVKEGNTEFVVDGTSVSLSGSMVEKLKDQTTGSAMFDLRENGIDLDKATLDALSGDVDLSIGKVADADLPADVKKAVEDRPVYSISLRAGDADVHNLGGKATVTLHYELKEGEEADNLVIWYVNDNGEYTRMPCTYSDAGFVVFETTHFSYYAVMYESPSGSPGDDDNTMIIAAVAVIALIAVLGLFLFFRSRKAGSA